MKVFLAIAALTITLSSCSVKYDEELQEKYQRSNLQDGSSQSAITSKCGRSNLALGEREKHEFSGNKFIRTKILYSDIPCENEIGTIVHSGTFGNDNNPVVEEVLIHAKEEKFTKYLNENSICNFSAYHTGQRIRFRGQLVESCPKNEVPTDHFRAVHQLLSDLVD